MNGISSISTPDSALRDRDSVVYSATRRSEAAQRLRWADQSAQHQAVRLKSPDEIEAMRRAGRVVHQALVAAESASVAGTTTRRIEEVVNSVIARAGGRSLFANYPTYRAGEGFPGSVCISVNEEVVHGVPGSRILRDGDIVTVDCGVRLEGWCGDSARTFCVGRVSRTAQRLIDMTRLVLEETIAWIRPGIAWSEIGTRMQTMAEQGGYGVVREYVGHGIGRELHEPPQAPAFVTQNFLRSADFILRPGMVLAIEPMLTLGRPRTKVLDDGWTVVTEDGQLACHIEHTVAVTRSGSDVLTDGR